MSQQDLRISKTLHQIDNALLENLRSFAFQHITIDMLCRSAMINRSTFYKYYSDKYDLLNKYIDRIEKEFQSFINCSFVTSSVSRIGDTVYTNSFRQLVEHCSSSKSTYLILWNAQMERSVFVEMVEIIYNEFLDELIDTHKYSSKKEAYMRLYARLFSSNCMTILRWYFENDDHVTTQDVADIMEKNMRLGLFQAFHSYCSTSKI